MTDGAVVRRTGDLSYAGSFGEWFLDTAFFGDGTPVLLRSRVLAAARNDSFIETGRVAVPAGSLRVFTRGMNAFVVGSAAASGGTFNVTKLAASALAPPAPRGSAAVPSAPFSIDGVFLSNDGVVHAFSRTLQSIVRWSAATRSYLASVPLRDAPSLVAHESGAARALVAYSDGKVTEIPLLAGATSERIVGNTPNPALALADIDGLVVADMAQAQVVSDVRLVLGPAGEVRGIESNFSPGQAAAWQPATRRLYSTSRFSENNSADYDVVPTGGVVPPRSFDSSHYTPNIVRPIRFRADGAVGATGSGRIVNADLGPVATLANAIADAAWLGTELFTIRALNADTEVQRWLGGSYGLSHTATVPGRPLRIFRLSETEVVVVTNRQGHLGFFVLARDLTVVPPPSAADFTGVYLGKIGRDGTAGNVGVYVRPDRTAAILLQLGGQRAALVATSFVVSGEGSFVAAARDLASGVTRTIAGTIGADGAVAGTIASLNLTFGAAKTTGGNAATGFYEAPALHGAIGAAYTVIGADGQSLLVAQSANTVESATFSMDPAAALIRVDTGTSRFEITATSGDSLRVDATSGAFANMSFAALRDDVAPVRRLANISTRGRTGAGEDAMIAGFVLTGEAPRTVLIRAIGPALRSFGVDAAIADPRLELFRGAARIAENDNWTSIAGGAAVAAASTRVGAFALPAGSADAALLVSLEPGNYTAQVGVAGGAPGVSLIEMYDADQDVSATAPRLVNIATRGRVGTGADALIAGIVVTGNAPKRLLVRAIGPTLGTFGVAGTLADPVLQILSGGTILTTNDDWANPAASAPAVAAATLAVGAFPLSLTSRDACVLLTMPPGNYTAQVTGKAGTTGVALVEVYEVNP